MANTLLSGDFIIVNLAAYKINLPAQIPLLGIPFYQLDLFNTGNPMINDLVVFRFPSFYSDENSYYGTNLIKRIVAGPGDTLQIINKKIFVNRREINFPPTVIRNYMDVKIKGKEDEGIFYDGSGWNSDNYGPIIIPAKGDTIQINPANINIWKQLIVFEYMRKVVREEGSVITIDDKYVREYIIQKKQYFVIGDNFNNSRDSRYFGFINEDMILGKAMFIYYSISKNIYASSFLSRIRWDRLFKGVK
ncbi:MAG: signal peptidase I [Ignavibacteria bacterium]|nr:MAG: signal peptidase I [Ignavibacteria bacterium]